MHPHSKSFITLLCCCIAVLLSLSAKAQGEANIWYFGQNAGLDFNGGGTPVPLLNGQMVTQEGCATISDGGGNLLFYTDGSTVWNANHAIMTNGTGLLGNFSSTQSAIIVPKPNSSSIYYIFTVPAGCTMAGTGLRYSEVDMSLSGGLGAVTTVKNILLTTATCEKVTAVAHANGTDYWVICHAPGTAINTYQITSAGVNTTSVPSTSAANSTTAGYLKASPDGTLVGRGSNGVVEVMNFDASTGILTPYFSITNSGLNYGVEFSQTGNRFYYYDIGVGVYQVDLTLGSAAAIVASNTFIGSTAPNQGYGMQIGPDGKIYVTEYQVSFLSVINDPDSLGASCNMVAQQLPLGGGTGSTGPGICRIGLPTFIQTFFLAPTLTVEDTCFSDTTTLTAYSPSADSVFWNFGDTASGTNNVAQGDTVEHIFSSPGTYQVGTVTYFTNTTGLFGFVDSVFDTIEVTIHPLPEIELGNDTVLCQGDSLTILNSNTVLNMTYLWSDGSTDEFLPIAAADTYYVEVTTLCGIAYDTIVIDSVLPSMVDLGPDSILCTGDTVVFDVEVAAGNYIWQDGTPGSPYEATTTGQYAVTATGLCNTSIDTVELYFVDPATSNFPPDTTFCNGQTVDLVTFADSATFLWHDGSTDSTFTASIADTFKVTVTNACGVFTDSVIVTIDFPLPVDLGNDTVLCAGTSFPLHADLPGNNTYLWSGGVMIDSITVDEPGTYWLEATNTCGIYSDTVEIDGEVVPNIELPERTLLCEGQTFPVEVPFSRSSYLWNTGSQDSGIVINSTGVYKVTVTNLCGVDQDSIEVVYDAPLDIDIGDVYELCEGDSLKLSVYAPNEPEYKWNNGSASSLYTVTEQGFYSVTVTNACGSFTDETAVYIERKPKPELPTDTVLCKGEEWSVLISQFYSGYQWQDGSQKHRYLISEPGRYTLKKWNRCGVRIDTLLVEYRDAPEIDLGADTVVCPSIEPVTLELPEQQGVSVLWSDESEDWVRSIEDPGVYEVMLTDDEYGCSSTDEVLIDECPVAIWIPRAFTPNSDTKNEVFLPELNYVTRYNLKIFDRWGAQLFTTINPDVGWDGTYQGILQPEGVYVYILEFKVEGMTRQKLTGAVTLIR